MAHHKLEESLDKVFQAKLDRRQFMRRLGVAATAAAALPHIGQYAFAQDSVMPSSVIAGKVDGLIVHNDRSGVLETPLELLREYRETPTDIMYIRNNQILEPEGRDIAPVPEALDGWTIELMGTVAFPRTVNAAMLADMEQREVEMVLQCSGNGRSFFARAVQTRGTQWGHGGMGNVVFRGVPLSAVLDSFQPGLGIDPSVNFITAEGRDAPPEGAARPDFEHSLPLNDALNRAILATHMNGEPLSGAHGGPVRLVVPGYYGTMNVKWLSRIRFDVAETNNVNQIPRYRVPNDPIEPGESITYTFENSTPNWRQKVKSVIFSPLNESELSSGSVTLNGVAWNDGTVPVTMVQVSTDDGATWLSAQLEEPESIYAWHHFSAELELPSGEQRIWVRAIDELGRSQPLNGSVHWNPSGYEWNGADYVDVTVGSGNES